MPQTEVNRTLILIKPDAIQRGLTGEIIKRFERKGFRIIKAEMKFVDEEFAAKHYAEHKHNEPYFAKMIEAITHGPVIALILEGINAPENSRQLIGTASPHSSPVGTIRGDLAYEEAFNLVHGSDSNSSAYREISMWFNEEDYFPTGIDPKKKKKMISSYDPSYDLIGSLQPSAETFSITDFETSAYKKEFYEDEYDG